MDLGVRVGVARHDWDGVGPSSSVTCCAAMDLRVRVGVARDDWDGVGPSSSVTCCEAMDLRVRVGVARDDWGGVERHGVELERHVLRCHGPPRAGRRGSP
jgi:hypothetical protein